MKEVNGSRRWLFLLAISVMFLLKDFNYYVIAALVLFCVAVAVYGQLDLDVGVLFLFFSSLRYPTSGGPSRELFRAMGILAAYQLGKCVTGSDKDNGRISVAFVTVPAIVLFIKGILDYSPVLRSGTGEIELYWPDWGGNMLPASAHEYYLVMIASLSVYFIYYTIKVNRVGIVGVVLAVGSVVIAVHAKGRLAFWASLITAVIVFIGIVIEKRLFFRKAFAISCIFIMVAITVVILLFRTNAFGLQDSYMYSMWSEEGGPIYNSRFSMMGQQVRAFARYLFSEPGIVEIDPGLINDRGEEVYYVSNTWLQIGRDNRVKAFLWTMAFSVYSFVIMIKAWIRSGDCNKYAVISAFIGITFLNTIEPAMQNNVVFWILEVYLAGMLRALYNNAYLPRKLETDIILRYV